MVVVKEFNNGKEDCVLLDSNFKIKDTISNIIYNPPIAILKRKISDYIETNEVKEIEE